MLRFCPLASGSQGNCLFLETENTKILIDAGLSFSTLKSYLSNIEVDLQAVEAILITHEHLDHIQGLTSLCKKLNIPIFVNSETAKGIVTALGDKPKCKIFTTSESFQFKDLLIHPFIVPHDTLDPVGFTIQTDQHKLGICTDLGHVTSLIKVALQKCDLLYLEANHQPELVHACHRPMIYKQRVLSKQGHLSNEECATLIEAIHHEKLEMIYLAHLSKECNRHELALQIVGNKLKEIGSKASLAIALQEKTSNIFCRK